MTIRKKIVNRLVFSLIPIFILLLGLAIDNRQLFQDIKKKVRKTSIPLAMLKRGETGKIVRLFGQKGRQLVYVDGIDKNLSPSMMPSSKIISPTIKHTKLSVFSIVANREDLYHHDLGIIANPFKRGMKWERPAYLSYYENGKLIFASGVGLRVHGGKSRGMAKKSFRIYFRNIYGNAISDPGIFFKGRRKPLTSFILHNDIRTSPYHGDNIRWHFTNSIAYDIARQIGCLTPKTKPVQLYLNGDYQGLYVLTERIDEDFLKAYFGESDYILVRTKNQKGARSLKTGPKGLYEDFRQWPMTASSPFGIKEVEKKVDLENYMSWILSILYCGTTDPFQGALVLPLDNDHAKWFWINWDMDHSFMDFYHKFENPWEIDLFDILLNHSDPRSVIFKRLSRESPKFVEVFRQFFADRLNYRLTSQFLESRINYYDKLSKTYGIEKNKFIGELIKYTQNRHSILRKQFQRYFNDEPMVHLRITSNKAVGFKIDEHPVPTGFDGWYFRNTLISIKIPKHPAAELKYWLVNGQIKKTPLDALQVKLTKNIDIEAVFS